MQHNIFLKYFSAIYIKFHKIKKKNNSLSQTHSDSISIVNAGIIDDGFNRKQNILKITPRQEEININKENMITACLQNAFFFG